MPVLSHFTYTAYVLADSLFFSSTPGASSSRGRLQVGGVCKSGASARASSRRERLQVGNAFKSGASLRRHEQFNAACLQCCIFQSNGKKKQKQIKSSSWVTFFNIFSITSTRFKRIYSANPNTLEIRRIFYLPRRFDIHKPCRALLVLFWVRAARDCAQSYRMKPVDSPLDSPASQLQLPVSAAS